MCIRDSTSHVKSATARRVVSTVVEHPASTEPGSAFRVTPSGASSPGPGTFGDFTSSRVTMKIPLSRAHPPTVRGLESVALTVVDGPGSPALGADHQLFLEPLSVLQEH